MGEWDDYEELKNGSFSHSLRETHRVNGSFSNRSTGGYRVDLGNYTGLMAVLTCVGG